MNLFLIPLTRDTASLETETLKADGRPPNPGESSVRVEDGAEEQGLEEGAWQRTHLPLKSLRQLFKEHLQSSQSTQGMRHSPQPGPCPD